MKIIESSDTVKIPPSIKVAINKRTIKVTGPRGSLVRDFSHMNIEIFKVKKDLIKIRKWFGLRKEIAAIRTVCSHIENLIKGVSFGFRYKMRSVYAHFPINISLHEKNSIVEVIFFFKFIIFLNMKLFLSKK